MGSTLRRSEVVVIKVAKVHPGMGATSREDQKVGGKCWCHEDVPAS